MRFPRSVLAAAVLGVAVCWPAPVAAETADCASVTPPPAVPAPDRLACADLRGFEFEQEHLAGVDLHGSNLVGVSFLQADLTGADLHGADLTGAGLGQADLAGANLRGANLTGAYLGQADLTNADLRGAVLTDAYAVQAFLTDADLRDADLTGTNLGQARLNGADLRDADLTGANLVQARTDGAVGLTENGTTGLEVPHDDRLELNADSDPVTTQQAEDSTQIGHVLLWPATALALAWWRLRLGHLLRHRVTTPLRPARVVRGVAGIGLVATGLYLAAVGAVRGFAHLLGGASWAADPGPLAWFGGEPHHQLAFAAGALVFGGIATWQGRRRRPADPSPTGAQVVVGTPSPGPDDPEFGAVVRRAAMVAAYVGLADLILVVVLTVTGSLPAAGPWRADTVVGHLVFVAIGCLVLSQVATKALVGDEVVSPSGVVFAGGGREPYVWLSGASAKKGPASQALPWEALEQVHLIRVLGTADPGSMMLTVRRPGADRPTEYPRELPVTPAQVAALRGLLPPELVTDHTRAAPSSG